MDLIISPAILRTFDECPRKFYLKYVENVQMPLKESAFITGKRIHAVANFYLQGLDVERFEKELDINEKKIWYFLKENKYFKLPEKKSEYELMFKLNGIWLKGRLDALCSENKNYYILDYKTGGVSEDMTYDYQTMIYLLAVSKKIKDYDELKFVYIDLKNFKEVTISFNKELGKEYEKRLIDVCTRLSKYNGAEIECQNKKCEYANLCPYL